MEDNPKVTIVVVIVVAVLGLGGLYIMNAHENRFAIDRTPADLPMSPDLPQRFEDLLNDLLNKVNIAMNEYKAERKALVQTLNPVNLREPSYVEENWKIMQELEPSLIKRMESIPQLFENAESRINELLANQPEKARQSILQKWNTLEKVQGEAYVEYFAYEFQLVTVYRDLMKFYYENRNGFEADINSGEIVFQDPAKKSEEQRMRQSIKDLTAEQSAALKESLPTQKPENPAP